MPYKVLDIKDAKITVHLYWDSKFFTQKQMIDIVMRWTAYYIDDRLAIVEYVKTLNKL
jgi:hypothetical protein